MDGINLIGRSRAERILDRIYSDQSQKIRKHLEGKAAARKRTLHRRKSEPKSEEPAAAPRERSAAHVTLEAALSRIAPLLKNAQKFPKAVKIAMELATGNLDQESASLFMGVAKTIGTSEFCTVPAAQADVAAFFKLMLSRAHLDDFRGASGSASRVFDAEQSRLLEAMSIRGLAQNSLHTDDTYEFNAQCDRLMHVLSSFQAGPRQAAEPKDEQPKEEEQLRDSVEDDFDSKIGQEEDRKRRRVDGAGDHEACPSDANEVPRISDEELAALRRQNFVSALRSVFAARNKPWARSSVDRVFSAVYRQRELFSPEEQREIEGWQQCLKSKKGGRIGAEVLGIGESANPIKDGRDEKISTVHGSIVWSAKQAGL